MTGKIVPQTAINAALVRAMLDHPRNPWHDESKWAQWCDMTPVVTSARVTDEPGYTGPDVWTVEVQYSSKGGRALYGVRADNVPTLYAD